MTVPHSNVVGPSTAVATPPDIVGPSTTAVTQLDVAEPSSALDAAKEACETETGSDTAPAEGVLDEKGSPSPIVPPSWEGMMEMLKCVPCFTDAEAPYTKMLDFFPLTKQISVNMSDHPPSFSARLPFDTPESVVFCIQHLQE